jgi:hypothetical protein
MLGGIVLAALAIAALAALEDEGTGLQLVDVTAAFFSYAESSENLDASQRVDGLIETFEAVLPGLYSRDMGEYETLYREGMAASLEGYAAEREGIDRVRERFRAEFAPAVERFESEFGRLSGQPVYLVHSFGEMDGGVRVLPEGRRLIFGADVVAKIYPDSDIAPLFHHELFHVFHQERFPVCAQVWCPLWAEGLAIHVAERLNPGASDVELGLVLPAPLRPAVESDRQYAICEVYKLLDSDKDDDYFALFSGSASLADDLPSRLGYFVGYLAAARLGEGRSLQELAEMDHAAIRPLLAETLRDIGGCVE